MAFPPAQMRAEIETRLVSLRDNPVNTADSSQDVLPPIYRYLMAVPTDPTDRNLHWFCARADSVTIGAATFLIRLFAYESELVEEWKKKLEACLTACPACVQSFGEVKITSRHT
jgi:senataxin